MFQAITSFRALLGAVALLLAGNGLLATLLALRANAAGFALEITGLVLAFYHLGFILGSLQAGRFIARAGHIRAFAAFAAIASSAALAHVLVVTPPAWMALRFLSGAAMAGLFMVTESWLNERASGALRGFGGSEEAWRLDDDAPPLSISTSLVTGAAAPVRNVTSVSTSSVALPFV